MLYTDGILYLAEEAKAYWLIDTVASWQPELRAFPFQAWELAVCPDKSALLTMVEDSGEPTRVSQRIPYTDFPLERFSFFYVHPVMMLRSEY